MLKLTNKHHFGLPPRQTQLRLYTPTSNDLSLAINNGVNTTPKEHSKLYQVHLTAGLLITV